MHDDLIPPRTSSRPLASSNPLARSTSHSRVSSEASRDVAIVAPQLVRRGNSDSASLTLERHLKVKQPTRGGTWREPSQSPGTWRDTSTAGQSSAQTGPARTLTSAAGLSDLFVTPGVTSSSTSRIEAQRTDRSPERHPDRLLDFQQRFGSMRSIRTHGRAREGETEQGGSFKIRDSTLRRVATSPAGETRLSGRKRSPSTQVEATTGKKRTANAVDDVATASTGPARSSSAVDTIPPASVQPRIDTLRLQRSPDVVLPRWQPDDEVDSCTVCGSAFSLWYRRHHCRKCGRVVCSSCSPHRITIPRQFIVQPPYATYPPAIAAPSTNNENSVSGFAARFVQELSEMSTVAAAGPLSGAEVVRVCNPCVPDPNFSPPPQAALADNVPSPALLPASGRPQIPDRSGSVAVNANAAPQQPDARYSAYQFLQQGYSRAPQGRSVSLAVPTTTPTTSGSFRASANPYATIQRHSMAGVPIFGRQQAPSRAPGNVQPLPQPTQPRRIIKEEDECPVCGRELPPKGPDGDETAREQHVVQCITSHSGQGSTSTPANPPAAEEQSTPEPQAVAGAPAPAAAPAGPSSLPATTSPIATPANRRTVSLAPPPATASSSSLPHPLSLRGTSSLRAPSSSSTSASAAPISLAARPHAPRMLVYHATEKDCTTSEGEPQECVICFEEFEEGDEMARLECLCKFHRKCISGWFVKKAREGEGMGCPTHVLGVWG